MAGSQPNNDGLGWYLVRRAISFMQQFTDTTVIPARGGTCGCVVGRQLSDKSHKLADEGSYFITRNPAIGTGLVTTAALSTLDDTKPWLVIQNGNTVESGRTIHLDYILMRYTVAGSGAGAFTWCTKKDLIPRYSSGGSGGYNTGMATNVLLGPYPTKTDAPANSGALIWASSTGANLAVGTAGPQLKTLGNGLMTSVTPTVNSSFLWNFAGCDYQQDIVSVAGAAIQQRSVIHQPVSLAPGHTFLMMLAFAAQTTASNFEIEIGHVER